MMYRVLCVLNRAIIGGTIYTTATTSKLIEPEFETLLAYGKPTEGDHDYSTYIKKLGLNYRELKFMRREISLVRDYYAYKELVRVIQKYKPDIVHTHAAKAGLIGRLAAATCKVPIIVHTFHGHVFHSYFNTIVSKIYVWVERYLAHKSTRIIAISPKLKEELAEVYALAPKSKIEIVALGLDIENYHIENNEKRIRFRERYKITDEEVAIGIVGRIVAVKNHTFFIDIIEKVSLQTSKKIRAFIIGDGECMQEVQDYLIAKQLPYNQSHENDHPKLFTLTSWIIDMDEVYAGLDIVTLTSLNEGTPVTIIEAQAANKPVVSTNVGGIKDIVLENDTALLSPSKDLDAFCKNLLWVIEDKQKRAEMSRNGYAYVKERFGKMRMAEDIKKLYYKLIVEKNIKRT